MNDIKRLLKQLELQESELKSIKTSLQSIDMSRESEKKTISYQLGHILIHDTKSLGGAISIPKKLFKLYIQSQIEKEIKSVIKSDGNLSTKPINPSMNKVAEKGRISERQQELNKIDLSTLERLDKGLTLLDPISELCWRDGFTGFPISRAEFEKQIKTSTSQFAFFESAWRANNSTWLYAFTSPELKHANAQALLKAIGILKKRKIPIIFWNKEDPMHYEMFKPIAKHADYVFTTDALIVDKYKQELGNKNVHALAFAAPVKKTNPLRRFSSKAETVCFAGTYYAQNHENRKKQMDMLLPALLESNGCIYDRASKEQKEEYAYPAQYRDIIRPAVDFEEMVRLYKKFQIFLNVNTITQSPTMMSRRIYELLASGTPVISTPSKAITEQFPGIVLTVNNEEEAKLATRRLLTDSYFWHKQSVLGIREIMHCHTYEQRWKEVESIVLNKALQTSMPRVRAVCMYHGYIDLDIFLETIAQQHNVNIPEIFIVKSDKLSLDEDVLSKYQVKVFNLSEFNVKSYIGKLSDIDYTFITDDRVYNFNNSIWGMSLAFKYAKVSAVIRSHYYKYSKLKDIYNYEINSPNWYEYMREAPSSCVLIDDKNSNNIIVDFHAKKIKSANKEPAILMIDPFNLVGMDNTSETSDVKILRQFIYKTAPYLGI